MPTTIRTCYFSPKAPAPEEEVKGHQLALLQRGQAHNISLDVERLVTRYFGHNTPDAFRLTLCRNQITYTVNGQPQSTLTRSSSGWTLTPTTSSPAPALDPELLDERVNTILEKIHSAANSPDPAAAPSPAPAPAPTAAALPVVAAASSPAPAVSDLNDLRTRVRDLELRAPHPNLTEMVQGQQRVEAQLDHLNRAFAEFAAARFRTGGNHSEELQDLRSRLDQLGRFCRDIEDRSKKSEAELGQKTAELERAKESMQLLREASQKSVDATRDRAQQEIDTLKAQIADLQRTHQELLKAQQKEHAKALGAIQTRLEELTAANKAQRETAETELARRGHEFAAQKSTLERQLEELKRANGNLDANLRAANETLERGLERAKQSNEAQARTVQQLEAALRFLEANKQLLSQDKDGIHRELLDAKSKIEQMADLQKQLETAQRESAAIQAKLSEQQTALAAEQEKNRQLGTNLAAAERKTADQAETIRSLQSSLEREQAEKQVANQENAREVQALIARHASDTSALERQLEEMQERLLEVAASLQVQLKHAEASRDHAAVAVQERLRKLLNSSNHK